MKIWNGSAWVYVTQHPVSDVLAKLGPDPTGLYVAPIAVSYATVALATGILRVIPVFVPRPMSLIALRAEVTTGGGAGSLLDLAWYDCLDNGLPGDLLAIATIDGNSVAQQEQSVTAVDLLPGMYWAGALARVAGPTVRGCSNYGLNSSIPMGATMSASSYFLQVTTATIPSTFGTPTWTTGVTVVQVRGKAA